LPTDLFALIGLIRAKYVLKIHEF